MEYKRLTIPKQKGASFRCVALEKGAIADAYDLVIDEKCDKVEEILDRLAELEDKIENGTLIEVDQDLIGENVIGIHKHTNGTYSLDLDENLVIGFADNGVVTWNNTHGYNDYFHNGLYFIDNDKGRAEAEQRLKELEEKYEQFRI